MAPLNIAFASPDNSGGNSRPARPIDFDHLARQTMGDKAVETEVLQLFARQARESLKDITQLNVGERKAIAHRLLGAARSVGANAVAAAAQALESTPGSATALAALSVAIIDADNFIVSLLR